MSMEGGLSPKVKVMEHLDYLALPLKMRSTRVQECSCIINQPADMEKLRAISCELEAIEQDFNETKQLVKGY